MSKDDASHAVKVEVTVKYTLMADATSALVIKDLLPSGKKSISLSDDFSIFEYEPDEEIMEVTIA